MPGRAGNTLAVNKLDRHPPLAARDVIDGFTGESAILHQPGRRPRLPHSRQFITRITQSRPDPDADTGGQNDSAHSD